MASKQKRKLTEMDMGEFLAHGLDSDVSEDEETAQNDEAVATEVKEKKSKTESHKNELERLKEKDPEFYKFLQENDKELLEFNDSETGSESEESEDEETEEKKGHEGLSDGEEEEEEEVVEEKHGEKQVTMDMIKKWKQELEKNFQQSFKQVVVAFHAAVHDMLGGDTEDRKMKYRVEGNTIFNALIQVCLRNLYPVLQNHLNLGANKQSKALPSSQKKWPQFKGSVKLYLSDILQLLRTLAEPTMLCVILKHAQLLVPFYACFPKYSKALIKRMVRMWGSGEEHIRVLAFIILNRLMGCLPGKLAEFALKQLYMGFVKNCKFTSPKTKPLIVFMENCLIELFSHDLENTYQHGFVYIRQLAIHLRNAIITKKKESHQSVYNWQYIHCLHLWSRILSEADKDGVLQPLIYPLVQITIGVIKLAPTARFYPLRFHCLDSLNKLSQATGTFIPVAPFLLEIIDSPEFNKKAKSSTQKPTDFRCILKVSKSVVQTKPFKDAVLEQVYGLLLEFFAGHAHSISFPELAFPAIFQLKQFIKKCKVPKYVKQIKQLVEKIQETSQEVTARRSTVSFSPKDTEQVEQWTQAYKQQPNALTKFAVSWKKMKEKVDAMIQHEEEEDMSDEEEDEPKPKKRKKNKDKQTSKKDTSDETEKNEQEDEESVEKELQNGDGEDEEELEDIVQDFSFSDEDSD